MSKLWTTQNIPDLIGKVVIITGANSGIGYETTKALAEKEATVIMACRNLEKAYEARHTIMHQVKNAKLHVIELDLASLVSVRTFAETFKSHHNLLHLLINNAGVMTPPFTKTAEGFELQFGANHLGHFALTGLLLQRLLATPKARIVNVSSMTHRMGTGTIHFDNLNAERGYNASNAYAQSKLANLLFTYELNRHLVETGSQVIATAAHPGWTVTHLQRGFMHILSAWFAQKPDIGALPTLRAAVDPTAQRNDYFGPGDFFEMFGYPTQVQPSKAAKDGKLATRLWRISEQLTGIRYFWPALA